MIFFLSPHADDVAFSCGASVACAARRGEEVRIITVFSESRHSTVRDAEDREAASLLGARREALMLPDAEERPEVRGRLDLFSPLSQRHLGILGEVVHRLGGLIPERALVCAPLGVGGHIDHRLLHSAARMLSVDRALRLSFYEDLPYSLAAHALARRLAALGARIEGGAPEGRGGALAEVRAYHRYLMSLPLARRAGPPGLRGLMLGIAAACAVRADDPRHQVGFPPRLGAEVRDVSQCAEARFAAMAAYRSQWPLFFSSEGEMRRRVLEYGARTAQAAGEGKLHERFWIEVAGRA